jgi:hypothetical protein
MKIRYLLFTLLMVTTLASKCLKDGINGYPFLMVQKVEGDKLDESDPNVPGNIGEEVGELFFSNKKMLIMLNDLKVPEYISYYEHSEYETHQMLPNPI